MKSERAHGLIGSGKCSVKRVMGNMCVAVTSIMLCCVFTISECFSNSKLTLLPKPTLCMYVVCDAT